MNTSTSHPKTTTDMAQLLAHFDRRDPAIEERIREGIETNRKGEATLRFVDSTGRPLTGIRYKLSLERHHFLFGANAFMLDGYDSAEQNDAYENAFSDVFNSAVVPFFWSDLEPERGVLRYGRNSRKISRRPPPDLVLEFCRRHNLTPKGHCLLWHQFLPPWLPKSPSQVMQLAYRRMDSIAERYRDQIDLWDVVNEPMEKYIFPQKKQLTEDYVYQAFRHAEEVFSDQSQLILNEATVYSWREFHDTTTGVDLLIENLRLRGARVDTLGMQYHYFFYENNEMAMGADALARLGSHLLDPAWLLYVLDGHSRLQLPLHVSEITLPTYADVEDGEALQARLTEELYRLWFSHPGVSAIYWWNLADGHAHENEGDLKAGLLREDLSPKPSYRALQRLIREEWTTRREGTSAEDIVFRGFHGDYHLEIECAGRPETHHFNLRPGQSNVTEIVVGQDEPAQV